MGLSFVKLFSRLFAKKEMPILMDELRDTVLLVFANKQDLSNATNATEITDKLGLHSLRQRHCTCATSGECLYEGLDWLSNNIARQSLRNQSMMLFTSNKG